MSAHDPSDDSIYPYKPLPNHNNTRLLHLQPGLPDEPLYGSLVISDLYDCGGTYEAISYAWGSSAKPQYISLDNRKLAITESLFTALQRFRSARSVRVLWADAVCIDQENESERSSQVNRMGQIYRGAASVLVWLGHEDEAHVQAVLRGICEFLEDGAELYDYYWHESQVQTFEGEQVLFDPNHGDIAGLLSMCACDWFGRGWVSSSCFENVYMIMTRALCFQILPIHFSLVVSCRSSAVNSTFVSFVPLMQCIVRHLDLHVGNHSTLG